MSFFKKWFDKKSKEEPQDAQDDAMPWIEASQNQWGIRLLDLQPVTQKMLSTSKDPQMAANAVSYNAEDGRSFTAMEPPVATVIKCNLSIPVDGSLAPGVLFMPRQMEHKWAIYYHDNTLFFIRSWKRQVFVKADTETGNNRLLIKSIKGKFTDEHEEPQFTSDICKFLLIAYAIGEVAPAPLLADLKNDAKNAAWWAFSVYGNKAQVGTFESNVNTEPNLPLRSHSLLHIAVARGDLDGIAQQVQNGVLVNLLAADGLAPLHWSIAAQNTEAMVKLLDLGADPDVRSTEGATPIMNAVQSNKIAHLKVLLDAKADIDATDHRGFTALHRAAEMGHIEVVKVLLNNGANKSVSVNGHTALSFAETKGHQEIIQLLM